MSVDQTSIVRSPSLFRKASKSTSFGPSAAWIELQTGRAIFFQVFEQFHFLRFRGSGNLPVKELWLTHETMSAVVQMYLALSDSKRDRQAL